LLFLFFLVLFVLAIFNDIFLKKKKKKKKNLIKLLIYK